MRSPRLPSAAIDFDQVNFTRNSNYSDFLSQSYIHRDSSPIGIPSTAHNVSLSFFLGSSSVCVCAAPSLNDDEFDINAINTFWPGDAATFAFHAIRLLVNCSLPPTSRRILNVIFFSITCRHRIDANSFPDRFSMESDETNQFTITRWQILLQRGKNKTKKGNKTKR